MAVSLITKPYLKPSLLIILVGSWPFISFISNNINNIFSLNIVIMIWIASLIFLFVISISFSKLSSNHNFLSTALIISFLYIVFFSYGSISKILIYLDIRYGTVHLLVWLTVFMVAVMLGVFLSKLKEIHFIFIVATIGMISIPLVNILYTLNNDNFRFKYNKTNTSSDISNIDSLNKPNVYWFMLDQYIRGDYLKKYFNYDNGSFLKYLENNGFYIAYNSYSNFEGTKDSLSTMLSMDYYMQPENTIPSVKTYVDILSGYNNVVKNFKKNGYSYYHGPYAGSAKTQCRGVEDECIRGDAAGYIKLSEIEVNLIQLTPLYKIITKLFPRSFSFDHLYLEDIEKWLHVNKEQPYFLFAHILSPHGPPRYNNNCEKLIELSTTINMNNKYYDSRQYVNDLRCVNNKMKNIIEYIHANNDIEPIIIIQGDHGFSFKLKEFDDVKILEEEAIKKRFANLNAIKIPKYCSEYFYDSISSVNTFRLVFSCIEDSPPHFISDRQFIRNETGFDEVFIN